MKTSLAVAAALLLAAPAAFAAPKPCDPGSPTQNAALARRFYEAMNQRAPGMLDDVLAPDWRDIPLPPGQGPGREGMKGSIAKFGTVFSDFKVTNDEVIPSGDKVVVRSTNRGVHTGAFAGLAPTGRSFAMTSIDIHTICNGRIVESRHVEDWLGTLAQLGALPLGHR